MDYNSILANLSYLTNRNIKQIDVAKALNIKPQALNNRIKRGVLLSEKDIKILEDYFNIKYQEKNNEECISIPENGDITASLGIGQDIFNEEITSYFSLPKSIFKEIGANPKTSCIINTSGESMYPTIIGGNDKILLDHSKKEIFDGKIYVIRLDHTLFAKRLQKLPNNKIKIISDNPIYETYTIDLNDETIDFEIIGRVMWICRIL